MCRHVAYVGTPIALADPLLGAPHALVRQARSPRLQTSGTSNPDGYGVAWYERDAAEPRRYRTVTPMWDDDGLARVIDGVVARAFLAAARLASPGAPIEPSGNAPFISGPWSFSLNGLVHDFTNGAGDAMRAQLSDTRRAGIEGHADTEVLFAMVLDRLDAGSPPDAALVDAVAVVERLAGGRLNCILTDGARIVATAVGNSLFVRPGWVASEPLDDHGVWFPVPDRSVVDVTAGAEPTVEPL